MRPFGVVRPQRAYLPSKVLGGPIWSHLGVWKRLLNGNELHDTGEPSFRIRKNGGAPTVATRISSTL
jgi:hypothetical protein